MITEKLKEVGIARDTEEFTTLGADFAEKFNELQALQTDNDKGQNDKAIESLNIELIALFDENYQTTAQRYERAVQTFLYEFSAEKKEAVHEVVLFVKYHKQEKDKELHIHMLKNGKKLHTQILKTYNIGSAVMTKIERLYTKKAKKFDTPVSMITYEVSLPQNTENLIVKPFIGGKYKAPVTIKDLI